MRALAAAVFAVAGVGLACGTAPSSFPDETECPAPVPIATSRANPGTISDQGYLRRVQSFTVNLERLRSDLRSKYPDDTFYRRDEFRPDFAQYASQTVCTAQSMLELSPPDTRFAEYDSALDAALQELIDHTRDGREAVRSRNVSDYREWYDGADRKIAAVRTVAYSQSR